MDATKVYRLLETISMGQMSRVSNEDLSYLEEKGLVSLLEPAEYADMRTELSGMDDAQSYLRNLENSLREDKRESRAYQNKYNSFWSFLRTSSVKDNFRQRFKETEARIKETEEAMIMARSDLEKLQGIEDNYCNYLEVAGKLIRPTPAFGRRRRQLNRRYQLLSEIPYDDFEKPFKSIESVYNKLIEIDMFLANKGWDSGSRSVNLALALTLMKGNFEENFKRAESINNFLYQQGYNNPERYQVVSSAILHDKDIESIKKELWEVYDEAISDDMDKCPTSILDAAVIMGAIGSTAKEKYARFTEFLKELNIRQWKSRGHICCILATNLARHDGAPEMLAGRFRNLEKQIAFQGRFEDCRCSGMAAIMAFDLESDIKEKADRCYDVYRMMEAYGWQMEKGHYASVAMIAGLPGDIEENVEMLYEARGLFDSSDNYFHKHLTARAASLVCKVKADMLNDDKLNNSDLMKYYLVGGFLGELSLD